MKEKTNKIQVKGKTSTKKKKHIARYVIDCKIPAEDQLIDVGRLERFLRESIKINGKLGKLYSAGVNLETIRSSIVLTSEVPFSKRYLKYLSKRFLRLSRLRDWLRVVASGKDTYAFRYFQIANEMSDTES